MIDNKGTVLTNFHVLENFKYFSIFSGNDRYEFLRVLFADATQDVALLSTNLISDKYISLGNSDSLKVGDEVFAIGDPLLKYPSTLSEGFISGPTRFDGTKTELQFTAQISHGSSGGALVNNKGELIGITFGSDEEGQSLNLAIPINTVKTIALDNPNFNNEALKVEQLLSLANNALNQFNNDLAITYFEQLLKLTTDNLLVYKGYAWAYIIKKDYEKATNIIDKALAMIDTTNRLPSNNGYVYASVFATKADICWAQNDFTKAIQYYKLSLEYERNSTEVIDDLSSCYMSLKNYDMSLYYANLSLAQNPNAVRGYLSRATIYYLLNKIDLYCLDIETAKEKLNTEFVNQHNQASIATHHLFEQEIIEDEKKCNSNN